MRSYMTRTLSAVFLTACALGATPVMAGAFTDAAAKVEAQAATDVPGAAIAAHEAYADFMTAQKFQMINATFVTGEPEGFGMYDRRQDAIFKPGEPLTIYCEPVGLAWRKGGRGFQSLFTVDFEVLDTAGKVLGGQKEFGRFGFDSAVRNQEILTRLTLNVDGIEPGDYVLRYIFNDQVSGNQTALDMPFTAVK